MNFGELIDRVLRPHEHANCAHRGRELSIGEQATNDLALVFRELATNAAKYGSLSTPDGRIDLTWRHDARLTLRWAESGGPPVTAPTRRGFGSLVIERIIGQLDGKVHFDWLATGLVCEISVRA